MHTPAQEAVAQLMFWSGIGSLPVSIGLFTAGFKGRTRLKCLTCLILGGVLLIHFLWYFKILGISLATKVGHPVYPSWLHFAPIGLGIALLLIIFSEFLKASDTPKT